MWAAGRAREGRTKQEAEIGRLKLVCVWMMQTFGSFFFFLGLFLSRAVKRHLKDWKSLHANYKNINTGPRKLWNSHIRLLSNQIWVCSASMLHVFTPLTHFYKKSYCHFLSFIFYFTLVWTRKQNYVLAGQRKNILCNLDLNLLKMQKIFSLSQKLALFFFFFR